MAGGARRARAAAHPLRAARRRRQDRRADHARGAQSAVVDRAQRRDARGGDARARRASWRARSSKRSIGSPRSPRSICASRACRGPSSSAKICASSCSSLVAFMRQELDGARHHRRSRSCRPSCRRSPPTSTSSARRSSTSAQRRRGDARRAGGSTLSRDARRRRRRPLRRAPIADTGEGIAPDHLPKIFDPFFSTKEGGTGLGLALTQQIVVEHGGKIEVRSEPGRGTTFIVRLVAAATNPVHTTVGARVA